MQNDTRNANAEVQTLAELIEDIEVAMLVSRAPDGSLVSRPLATLQADPDGALWFFTHASSGKVDDIAGDPRINLSYARPGKHLYVSVTGRAEVIRDRAKIDDLWSTQSKIFFPGGKDDPDLALLRVEVDSAEYWRSTGGLVGQALKLVRAIAGDGPQDLGENRTLDVRAAHG
ncbi:pyridoxamine 5'-phosphate oxidase family protein [Pseudofulvimonas gallinarii]|jgi:general stress protein 26|uniref:General stress protein 26 n=1 Tax=Pseudofulvimonas gallinarii TaxID=634155 RepID=A0A4S3KWA4_9GAMM|nr:pyridoxamine 5'-phosphate oxidase family protein [Pseudofulvimonas gallinarii]TCT00104.1 general stress protein 26 [Pseudofulvimonas gallinarii]THD13573.1 hypothetical protein B1808_07470 [Pseudofulvimonas gallinarii]